LGCRKGGKTGDFSLIARGDGLVYKGFVDN
jgi:hypothetical protein